MLQQLDWTWCEAESCESPLSLPKSRAELPAHAKRVCGAPRLGIRKLKSCEEDGRSLASVPIYSFILYITSRDMMRISSATDLALWDGPHPAKCQVEPNDHDSEDPERLLVIAAVEPEENGKL